MGRPVVKLPRRIAYLTGTRADFGLMRATLSAIHAEQDMHLVVYATGMHLDPAFGETISEVETSGLPKPIVVPVEIGKPSGELMATNIGRIVIGLVSAFRENRPDVLLLLGDRGEMLAGAIAAIHLNIPIAHIHGGERSGTVDEPVRHAISKLAHLHLVATSESRDRLLRMGERSDAIIEVGAPGLDGIVEQASLTREVVFARYGLEPALPVALFLFHPVLQEADTATEGVKGALKALAIEGIQVLALKPNSDAGSVGIIDALDQLAAEGEIRLVTHMPRQDYLSAMRHAAVLVGNSSSFIIEAASFGTPVVNIGSRQNLRERNANVLDVSPNPESVAACIRHALAMPRFKTENVYGDGATAPRIVTALRQFNLQDPSIMDKANAY